MRKAQGALEYLIIIAAVLGISAVVVLFITGTFTGSSGGADISKCRLATANCKKDMAMGLSATCPTCDTACIDSFGKDLLSKTPGCGTACQQCKTGTMISSGSGLSFGLVGYWKFDETAGLAASDSSGQGNIGTFSGETMSNGALVNSPARVAGKYGNALSFNGINTYVDMGNAAVLNPTDSFTVMAWVNTSDNAAGHFWDIVVSKDMGDYPNKGWRLVDRVDAVDNRGYEQVMMGCGLGCGGTGYGSIIAPNWIADGNWHHWAATLTSKRNVALYLDGVNVGNTVLAADFVPSASNFYVGDISYNFNGVVDSVRFFNRSLNPAEIQGEMGSSRPTSRAVGVWEFDESLGTVANDTHIWMAGKYGGGLDFDGRNDYVSIGNKPSFQIRDNVSLSVWVKTINDGGQHTSVSRSYAYMVNGPYNGVIEFYGHDGVDGSGCSVGWTYDNSWVHLVAVIRKYTGEWTVKGYVNGVEKCANTNANFDGPRNTNEIVDIGRIGGATDRYFNGAIDEVRIYNRTLSQDEVMTLYNAG